ncbi:hypothetical protein Vi05172_g6687 [Venturia inaequalis]|nr:hypothetical protein Vi05172_g6687 [Venturia inaequalis]
MPRTYREHAANMPRTLSNQLKNAKISAGDKDLPQNFIFTYFDGVRWVLVAGSTSKAEVNCREHAANMPRTLSN